MDTKHEQAQTSTHSPLTHAFNTLDIGHVPTSLVGSSLEKRLLELLEWSVYDWVHLLHLKIADCTAGYSGSVAFVRRSS